MPSALRKSASTTSLARRNSAYVEVPSAPYSTSRQTIADSASGASSSKENTPFRPNRSNKIMPSESISAVRKRKLSDVSHKAVDSSTRTEPSAKKAKPSDPTAEDAMGAASDSDFYCHQCNRKRSWLDGVQCTRKLARGRCGAKYCRNCLRNRYNESLDDIKKRGIYSLAKKARDQHAVQDGFYFDCPRCRDVCNCSPCRKQKGLQPMGKFVHESTSSVKDQPAKRDEQKRLLATSTTKNSTATSTSRPKDKGLKMAVAAPRPETKKGAKISPTSASKTAQTRKPKAATKAKEVAIAKPLPKPVWTRIDTSLDQLSAESRIYIRESVQRFSSVLDISKTYLDELEEITGTTGEHGARIGDGDDEDVEGWVSEPCVKSIILGLLDVIASSTDNQAIARVAKDPISDVRASGANLNKIWVALAALRDGLRRVPSSPFQYPDPLPPPASVSYRTTRHTHQTDTDLFVGNSAQLVPVVSALIESALRTKVIHEAIERGLEQEKSLARDVREEVSRQKALFEELKSKGKGKGPSKAEREQVLQDIEHAQSVAFANCIHRYAPVGRDHEGRLYYFLTPSEAEREAALQLIAGRDARVKISRRRGGYTEEDRRAMRRWSWFVAVWGRPPKGAVLNETDEEDTDEEEVGDEPRWWGFYEPDEIRKMAEWIAMSCEVGDVKPQHSRRRLSGKSKASGGLLEVAAFGSSPTSSRAPSPMSDLSDDEEDSGSDDEDEDDGLSAYMRVDSEGRPVPTKRQLRGLVEALRDYADLLQWRIRRVGGDEEKNGAGSGAIPAKKFYQ